MRFEIKINLTFDILDADELKATEEAIQSLFKFLFNNAIIEKDMFFSENIKKIWPYLLNVKQDEIINCKYEIVLLPLNRVGAEEGASGSKVFVAYFKSPELNKDTSSNPLIFKYDKINVKGDNLAIEKSNADSVISFTNENFAIPLYHSVHDNFSFLWAPFTSSVYPYTNGLNKNPIIRENNLLKLILSSIKEENITDVNKVNSIINGTYRYFEFWHNNNGHYKEINKTYYEEYKWYLRDIASWSKGWFRIWGNSDQLKVNDFDIEWINPFWVYNKIKEKSFSFKIGAIHGDLHPRNIVIAHDDKPKIIDFGWTQAEAHFAKDFALMEANIRFVSLHPDFSFNYLRELSQSIELDSFRSTKKNPVFLWLNSIRVNLNKCCEKDKFLYEYIIPLFLVSLGLLKFSDKILNQISARLTILELANYIYKNELKNGE